MITEDIQVKKRNGRGLEPLDLNKIHVMVEEACRGVSGVSAHKLRFSHHYLYMTASQQLTFRKH